MQKELKIERIPLMVPASLLSKIDDYRFSNRIGSRAEAIRCLISDALDIKGIPAQAGE